MGSAKHAFTTRRQIYAACTLAGLTFASCAALMAAAVIERAPLGAVPLAVLVCIGCPVGVGLQLPPAIAALRRMRARPADDEKLLATLRGQLARLPETDHPLDR
jgi:hypothetical protein